MGLWADLVHVLGADFDGSYWLTLAGGWLCLWIVVGFLFGWLRLLLADCDSGFWLRWWLLV